MAEYGSRSDERHLLDKDGNSVPCWFRYFVQPCFAEFIGTTFFVFVGCMSINGNTLVNIALAHGFMILLLVSALGPISGGHFNPAVSLSVALSGGISPLRAVFYVLCQIAGGLMGAGLAKGVLPAEIYNEAHGGAQDIGAAVGPGRAIFCETLLTCILVLTVLMTAVDTEQNKLAPLAIGLSIVVCILAGGRISGASMNPARSFGPAVAISTHTNHYWTHHYVYWVGPLLGALLASLIYRILLGNDEKRFLFN